MKPETETMHFFIKEWPDKTATFMTDVDQVLWTFTSLAEARQACRNYYAVRIHTAPHSIVEITRDEVTALVSATTR